VFPVLHGPFGEDGTVQGLCEVLGLPYVGSGRPRLGPAMDKHACTAVLRDAGLRVADFVVLAIDRQPADDPRARRLVEERFAYPVFVKPARLGSSVGISKVHGPDELVAALHLAYAHDPKVLVEEFIAGRELECGVLGNEDATASPVGEVLSTGEWYELRREVQRRRLGAGRARRHPAGGGGCRSGRWRSRPSAPATAPGWRASTSSCPRTADRS
jgi:D-alanine-D-alanine ligase